MHRAFNIEDIVASVCRWCARDDLARLARCSKFMRPIAQRELWAYYASIFALLRQLPKVASAAGLERLGSYALPSYGEWKEFNNRAKMILHLTQPSIRSTDTTALKTILLHRPHGGAACPNLTSLHWSVGDVEDLYLLNAFISRSMKVLTLVLDNDSQTNAREINVVLKNVSYIKAPLSDLEIIVRTPQTPFTNGFNMESSLLRPFPRLKRVNVPIFNDVDGVLGQLSCFPFLNSVSLVFMSPSDSIFTRYHALKVLTELELRGNAAPCTAALSQCQTPNLQILSINISGSPTTTDLERLWMDMTDKRRNLRVIKLAADSAPTNSQHEFRISKLLSFELPEVTEIVFLFAGQINDTGPFPTASSQDPSSWQIHPDIGLACAAAWPRLQRLTIHASRGRGINLATIINLITEASSITYLSMAIDGETIPSFRGKAFISSLKEFVIYPGGAISDPFGVAVFLSGTFPMTNIQPSPTPRPSQPWADVVRFLPQLQGLVHHAISQNNA